MTILNNTLHLIHVGPTITLKPGANVLENTTEAKKTWEDAKTLPVIKARMENGDLEEKVEDITTWALPQFKVAVETIMDIKALVALDAKVTDAAKKKVIADQIAYLTKK